MNVDCYLVIGKKGRYEARVRRVTTKRPRIEADEAMVKLVLDLPSDVFEAPVMTVPIAKRQIAVAVEVDEAPV